MPTMTAKTQQITVRGTVMCFSSIIVRSRVALPVIVTKVRFSKTSWDSR